MSKKKEPSKLLQALDFIAVAQKDKGAPYQTHVVLKNNMAVAFDGVLAAGVAIDESLAAVPHTMTLIAALKKCEGALAVAQLDSGRLSVKSGKFRALVPCMPSAALPDINPDPQVGVMDNRIRMCLEAVSPIIVENSQRVVMASALIRSGSVLATNGHVLIEVWHGIDMPPGLIVPKLFINALSKITKNIVGFGFSQTSFTVYFEDASWLRTQLYKDKWPDCDAILAKPHNATPLPATFFTALNTIMDFTGDDNRIYIGNGRMQTHADDTVGAAYEVDGLVAHVILNSKNLKLLESLATRMDLNGTDGISFFYGENVRGAVTQIRG